MRYPKKFDVYPGREVGVLSRSNACYRFPGSPNENKNIPLRAEIVSVGRVYFEVLINGYVTTRFRKDDFTSADKEENTRYELFESVFACEEYVRMTAELAKLRDTLNKVVWGECDDDVIQKLYAKHIAAGKDL